MKTVTIYVFSHQQAFILHLLRFHKPLSCEYQHLPEQPNFWKQSLFQKVNLDFLMIINLRSRIIKLPVAAIYPK
uniref:Uncharacterized protein n=1 Tax=Anguilla anguilla TaxID=7936 RepID=A0A0E9PUQ0_ANGAN